MDDYKFAILATDVAILSVDGGVKVLLTDAKDGPFAGMPTLPGGLIKPNEKIREAVGRFISKVLSTKESYREQLFTFGNPGRDPSGRVVSVTYLALLPWVKAQNGIKRGAYWAEVDSVPPLGYDHNEVLKTAVTRLKAKVGYTNIVFGLMPNEFTLAELQGVYETILKKKLDKRNFRKKIHSLNILKRLSKRRRGEASRPAQLYGFRTKRLKTVEVL